MIKEEMDLECHLIRFRHGVVVNKQVAQPLSVEKVKRSSRVSTWEKKNQTFILYSPLNSAIKF